MPIGPTRSGCGTLPFRPPRFPHTMSPHFPRFTLVPALLCFAGSAATLLPAAPRPVFFGGYAEQIHGASFDPESGVLGEARPLQALPRASFLARSADGHFLFAVSEVPEGSVHAYAIASDQTLSPINSRSSEGASPCSLALSPDGRLLAVANYNGGSVIVFPVDTAGRLGERVFFSSFSHASRAVIKRQQKPHAHDVVWSPDGARLFVCDLGGDRVYTFARDLASDSLAAHAPQPWLDLPPGTGPRHAAFSPDARHLYLVNELDNTVAVLDHDAGTGVLRLVEKVSTLPPEGHPGGSSTAELAVHPAGHSVYASNRGADTLTHFQRDPASGRLIAQNFVPVPAVPRHFSLSPDGGWLLSAGQKAGSVAVFAVDPGDGTLSPRGEPVPVPRPACVRF